MKRNSFLVLVALLALAFSSVNAQEIVLDHTVGEYSPTQIRTGVPVEFHLRWTAGGAVTTGSSNGLVLYSPGADVEIAATGEWNTAIDWSTMYDGGLFVNEFLGQYADTIGFGGFKLFAPGIPGDFDDISFIMYHAPFADADSNKTVCLDSTFYPPGGSWLWSTSNMGAVTPGWSGPHCWELYKVPNESPQITNCAASAGGSHCDVLTYDFDAADPEQDPFTFTQVSGPGSTNAATGEWSWAPTLADVGGSFTVEVQACDNFGCGTVCAMSVNVSNVAPSIACKGLQSIGKGNPITVSLAGSASNDCDPISFSIASVDPAPVGTYTIDPTTGAVTFSTDEADGGNTYTFVVCATDGVDEACCDLVIEVLETEPFEVEIEKTHNTTQGMHELVDVTLTKGSEEIRGFDFLIGYDPSALSFQAAVEGSAFYAGGCGWEYFTYRYGPAGNCSGGCPSGKLRVVGIADQNNGANHPSCFMPALPAVIFKLDFLVSDNYLLECMYVPIRFWWLDCGDNSIAFNPAEDPTGYVIMQGISRTVTDYDQIGEIQNGNVGFPTYLGAQDECLNTDQDKPSAVRFIDFINGGIDIVCVDSIDGRGDVNLNGTDNEIADAVLFTNYFIYGLGVFTVNVQGQIASTDVNNDGITLSVADLVTLVRIVQGDELPIPKIAPVAASMINDNGVYSVDSKMGAAYFEVSGNVAPTLLADNMDLQYNYENGVTRIIVSSIQGNSFEGAFIDLGNANVINVELATSEGAPVVAKTIPANYSLNQNYPNPFNPSTEISFSLAAAGEWTVSIYNVTGQKVSDFSGTSEAGPVKLTWNATETASGVYFYKLTAGDFSDTKKMVLLK